jgi:hypothetical protein
MANPTEISKKSTTVKILCLGCFRTYLPEEVGYKDNIDSDGKLHISTSTKGCPNCGDKLIASCSLTDLSR